MKKLRIAEMNIFIYCIIYFDGIMEKKTISLITISNCFLACKPWCIKITFSKIKSTSDFFLNDILHDYVQKNYFCTYLNLIP